MPAALTASTSSGTRTTLSISEYSVCSLRWTNSAVMGRNSKLVARARQDLCFGDFNECNLTQRGACKGFQCDTHGAEGAAMQWGRHAGAQGLQMQRRAVAFMDAQMETGITL